MTTARLPESALAPEPLLDLPPTYPAAGDGGGALIPVRICLGWGVGAMTMALVGQLFTVLALRFGTDFLGISAAVAGSLIGLSKLFDAVCDPLIGGLSDNLRTRGSRRRPFLLVGIVLCPAAIIAMFCAPDMSVGLATIWYGGALLLYSAGYAVWTVPYLAMAAEMTTNYDERTRLVSYRVYFFAIGLLIGSLCVSWLVAALGGGRIGHARMGLVAAAIIVVTGLICYLATRRARFSASTAPQPLSLVRQLGLLAGNRPLAMLVLMKGCWFFNVAAAQASLVYFLKYVARIPDFWIGIYFFVLTGGMIATQFLWVKLSLVIDKKWTMVAALAGVAVANLSWVLCDASEPRVFFVLRLIILGSCSGGVQLLIQSMFNDVIELDYRRTGIRREGAFTGIYCLIEKAFTAAGVAAVGLMLGMMGYVPSKLGTLDHQPASAIRAVVFGYSIFPSLMILVGLVAILFYNIRRDDLAPGASAVFPKKG